MHRIFRKDQVLTIPNLVSVIRLALIPLIVWLYIGKQEYSAAVAVILISGATDIIDGFIARKFNIDHDDLKKWNQTKALARLQPGFKLTLWTGGR